MPRSHYMCDLCLFFEAHYIISWPQWTHKALLMIGMFSFNIFQFSQIPRKQSTVGNCKLLKLNIRKHNNNNQKSRRQIKVMVFLEKNLHIKRKKVKISNSTPTVSVVSKNLQFIEPLWYVRHKANFIIFCLPVNIWLRGLSRQKGASVRGRINFRII